MDPDWHFILKMTCRDAFDMISNDNSFVVVPQVESFAIQKLDVHRMISDDASIWVREGGEDIMVDSITVAAEYAKLRNFDDKNKSDDANDTTNMDED